MTLADIIRWAYKTMEYPSAILAAIPLIIIAIWLLRHQFVKVQEDKITAIRKRKVRRIMHITRPLMILLLCIALASPYVQQEKIIKGDPFVEILIDNSTSMELFEDVSAQLTKALEKRTNTEVKLVARSETSALGDAILNNIKPHTSIVLLSDGNANKGSSLGDVALFASKLNATINAIELKPARKDAAVNIIGPDKILEGAETKFTVTINKVGNIGSVPLKVALDGETIYDQQTSDKFVSFTKQLGKGTHKITATIGIDDHFPQNNERYKTIRVVAQPRILLLTQKASPLETLFKQLYVTDVKATLPSNLKDYYAIVANDIPASEMNPITDAINDFVANGNGLVVFGGENSYDNGEYADSIFETMLPVVVGQPQKEEGDVLIAVVIDISGSQGAGFGRFKSSADFSKAAAIDIMRNVKLDTRVAIIAFNTQAYLLSEPSPVFSKKGVEALISRIKWGGGTNIAAGILKATAVLSAYPGSKNIILLSDGKTQGDAAAKEAAKFAANAGIKIYTVGVGPSTDEQFMIDIADLTNGIYFRATEESRLKILFGPVDEQEAQSGKMSLVILNKNHFITQGLEPEATLYGFNQVSPKGAARLLATTSTGEPVLTTWRLGLGRVAAFSVDDGSKWAGDMLAAPNSKLITRTVNWAIGDPERKSTSFIEAKDTTIGEPAEITIRSQTIPDAEGVVFYKLDEDTYGASIIPTQTGFQSAAGATFAVNYANEYAQLGFSEELESVVAATGGKIFPPNAADQIVEQAKTRAERVINARKYYRSPFIIAAAIILLLEIFIRRIMKSD
ncbi:VWA domain-containing protein [Candidatus Woesearchaeota archaeon]|nr:MAG: VWA domain-containing protein [Candidatus Woesearchaeota archaeon]